MCSLSAAVGTAARTVDIIDLRNGHATPIGSTGGHSVAYSPDGHILAVGCANGQVDLWPLDGTPSASGTMKSFALKKHQALVWALAFSPDGKTLASGGAGQQRGDLGRANGRGPDDAQTQRHGRGDGDSKMKQKYPSCSREGHEFHSCHKSCNREGHEFHSCHKSCRMKRALAPEGRWLRAADFFRRLERIFSSWPRYLYFCGLFHPNQPWLRVLTNRDPPKACRPLPSLSRRKIRNRS